MVQRGKPFLLALAVRQSKKQHLSQDCKEAREAWALCNLLGNDSPLLKRKENGLYGYYSASTIRHMRMCLMCDLELSVVLL